MLKKIIFHTLGVFLFFIFLYSCTNPKNNSSTDQPERSDDQPTLESITISPTIATITLNHTKAYTATGHYSDESLKDITEMVIWGSTNGSVATISQNAIAKGIGIGNTDITATLGTVSGSGALTVEMQRLSIHVTPENATLAIGDTLQYTAILSDQTGPIEDITSDVTWHVNTQFVRMSPTGLATSISMNNQSAVVATFNGLTSNSGYLRTTGAALKSIIISPSAANILLNGIKEYTATGLYSNGSSKNITSTVKWESSDESVATIATNGIATGVGVGNTNITATLDAVKSNSETLTVEIQRLSIHVTPESATLPIGDTLQYTAILSDQTGPIEDITSDVTWHVNTKFVRMSPTGRATAIITNRESAVIATFNHLTSNPASLKTTAAALKSIIISPSAANILLNGIKEYTATGLYSNGSSKNITSIVKWESSDESVATVSENGTATGIRVGATSITATLGTVSGSGALTVEMQRLSIHVTPESATLPIGDTLQYTAILSDQTGPIEDITSDVTWHVNTQFVRMSPTGLATSISMNNQSAVVATFNDLTSNSAYLKTTAAVMKSITISPNTASIPFNGTKQYTATILYSDGSSKNITNMVSWSSTNPSVATISSSGIATSVGRGTTNITATLDTVKSDPGTLQVEGLSITIAPDSGMVDLGKTLQYNVTLYDETGSRDITSHVTWDVNKQVVKMSPTGLASGVSGPGSSAVTATYEGVRSNQGFLGFKYAQVPPASLESISVRPTEASIGLGTSRAFIVTGHYSDGSLANIDPLTVTWVSSDPSVAIISANGITYGISPGVAHITATDGNIVSLPAQLKVTPEIFEISNPFGIVMRDHYAYVTDIKNNTVVVCKIDNATADLWTDCRITGSGFTEPKDISIHDMHAYITNLGNHTVSICKIDNAEDLTECTHSVENIESELHHGMGMHDSDTFIKSSTPNGLFAYILKPHYIAICKIQGNAILNDSACVNMEVKNATMIAIKGSEAYITTNTQGEIIACAINTDGTLSNCTPVKLFARKKI